MESLPEPTQAGPSVLLVRGARIGLLGAWGLIALIHMLSSPDQRLHTWPLSYALLEVLATLCLGYRARVAPVGERLAWTLLAVSTLFEVINLSVTFLSALALLGAWTRGFSNVLTLLTGGVVLAGVLCFPRDDRWYGGVLRRRLLDGLIFAASLLFLLYVMGVEGALRSAATGIGPRIFVSYLNAALLGGGIVFMTAYHPDHIWGPLGWLGASSLAWIAALSCWAVSGLPSAIDAKPWILLAGCIPLFQGLAACSYSPASVTEARGEADRKLVRWFPYLPVALALVALALLLPFGSAEVFRGAMAVFLVMVFLLLIRQVQAIQDLERARRTLEDRVQLRTEALERAQNTLLRTERLNGLALMGAGLAHDLNNLLGAIRASAELVSLNLEDGKPPEQVDLERIMAAADRASGLTSRLMRFVRHESEDLLPVDLGHEIKGMEPLLRLLLPHTVQLCIEVPPGVPLRVMSSRLRLEQMLVNLVANARDAMPNGGQLGIRVAAASEPAGCNLIEVSDTGTGMSAETLERIFEPFFTTKAPGMGTGLGLPSLKAMVESSKGSLTVASEPGNGSCFRIFLPHHTA